MSELLEVYNLRKDYESPAGAIHVLRGVDFSLKRGQMSTIIGRSGSGKSTLLHLLGGLDTPSSGRIVFEGRDLTETSESGLAKIRNRQFGFVFQFYHLLPELTLYENVMLPSFMVGKKDHKWVKELLKRVKLLSRQDHYPSELSGGEQQRAALARALVNHPSVVFCDEPTGNLDRETAESILGLMNDLNQQEGQAFIIVTHDEVLAWRYPLVFRLVDGALVKEEKGKNLGSQERAF